MRFADIPGQEDIKERLRNLVDTRRMPHALLLEGPEGCYKLAMARALTQYIHCRHRTPEGDSCGKCPACLQSASLNHIDTMYVYPVVKRDIDKPVSDDFAPEWRRFVEESPHADIQTWTRLLDKKNAHPTIYVSESNALNHRLNMTAHPGSEYRTVVIWLPERMNVEAANKLLKMIEEPFPDTLLIMVSDNPREILPTVYSRLQRIEMKHLSEDTVSDILVRKYEVEPSQAEMIAHSTDGNVNEALRMLSLSDDNQARFEQFVRLMRLAYQRKVGELRDWANQMASDGREEEIRFYEYAQRLVRENFIYNFSTPQLNYLTPNERQFSTNFARFINEANVEEMGRVFNNAITDIASNGNEKIINFDVALKICFLIRKGVNA